MKRTLLATLALLTLTISAEAQRCPAGQDQFNNCLSMDSTMRARQEQWANQPAARRIPGAQPYGAAGSAPPLVTGTTPTRQGVNYRMNTPSGPVTFVHHRDGKSTTVTRADGSRFTLVTVNCGNDHCMYHNGRLWRRTPR
jgi:hypothetical protein